MRRLVCRLRFFPKLKSKSESIDQAVKDYQKQHVHEVYWGLRPLIRQKKSTLYASREHALIKESNGLWSVPGVKLTAGRVAGENAARQAWGHLRGNSAPRRKLNTLPGGEFGDFRSYVMQARNKMGTYSDDQLKYLIGRYGTLYTEVLRWTERDTTYREKVVPDEQWMYAEVAYAVHHEMAMNLNDFLWRRSRWARLRELPSAVLHRIADIMGHYLGWSKPDIHAQLAAFQKELKLHRPA
jgi:glycerol-3-phosphate dehydrogenase